MEIATNNLIPFQKTNIPIEKNPYQTDIGAIFNKTNDYINIIRLFLMYFNTIPNIIVNDDIYCPKANEWFVEEYNAEIKEHYFIKHHCDDSIDVMLERNYYVLFDGVIVYFENHSFNVKFVFSKTKIEKVEIIIRGIKKFKQKVKKKKAQIKLLINSQKGITTTFLTITKPKLSISDNYNDDFICIHQTIYKRLTKNNNKGLVLLHGKPGTGKTSYIRYLIATIKKDIIFLPPNMASAITNPDLITILTENPNSIFVIEDAENIVIDRERNGHSPVSALLNIADGLLSDCLNIQIICSFNIDISKVDNALMRKGRLIAKYEFKELEIEKAQQLSNKLGYNTIIEKPMTLTSIYNQDEKDFQQSRKRNMIGFQAINNG